MYYNIYFSDDSDEDIPLALDTIAEKSLQPGQQLKKRGGNTEATTSDLNQADGSSTNVADAIMVEGKLSYFV